MRIFLHASVIASVFLFAMLLYCVGSDDEEEDEIDEEEDDDDTAEESDSPCVEGDSYESMQWLFDECFDILGYQDEPISADGACHTYLPEDILCFIDCANAFNTCNDAGLSACLQDCGLEIMK